MAPSKRNAGNAENTNICCSQLGSKTQKSKNPTPRRCNLPESLRTVLRLQMEWDEHRGGRDPVGCSPSRSSDPSGGIRDSNETIPSFRTKTGAAQTRGELASACIA